MKNDCLLRFITDGLIFHGNQENHQTLTASLLNAIFPENNPSQGIPPIPERLAIQATASILSVQSVKCELSFTPFKTIPYEDYYGAYQQLSKNPAYIGLGYDPKRIFDGEIKTKHISIVKSCSEQGLILDDIELENPVFRTWEDIEIDTLPVNGGFWSLTKVKNET